MKRRLDHYTVTTLASALAAASASVRYAAVMTLGKLDNETLKPHIGAIVGLLTDSNERVRCAAALTLGELDKAVRMPHGYAIIGLLNDSNEGVRHAAAIALGGRDAVLESHDTVGMLVDTINTTFATAAVAAIAEATLIATKAEFIALTKLYAPGCVCAERDHASFEDEFI